MKVINQRICHDDGSPFPYKASPNVGGTFKPDTLIIHYTEGQSVEGAVAWLTNPASQVSSHIVIGRDGSIIQLVPFNVLAWHAGASSWQGRTELNKYSIGIELDNAGMLQKTPIGWKSSFHRIYPDSDVIVATHKFGSAPCGWQTYPTEQLKALSDLAILLIQTYGIKLILGHDDIAPKRKWDPGPAFPMDSFRTFVFAQASGQTPATPPVVVPPAPQPQPAPAPELPPVVVPPLTPPQPDPLPVTPPQAGPVVTPPEVPAPAQPPAGALASRIPAIEYHDSEYGTGSNSAIQMKTEWFQEQLQWLSDNGYKSLNSVELLNFVNGVARPPQKSFVLRFDMGLPNYQNFHDVILPTLQKHSFHAFFFVLTKTVTDVSKNNSVTWGNLKEWEQTGLVEVGSHGVNHPDYNKINWLQRLYDLRTSKTIIETKLGHPISFFAFPYDSVSPRPDQAIKPLGYKLAFAGRRLERSIVFKDPNPFELPCYYPYSSVEAYPMMTSSHGLTFPKMIEDAISFRTPAGV